MAMTFGGIDDNGVLYEPEEPTVWDKELVKAAKLFAARLAEAGMYEQADDIYGMIEEDFNASK